MLVIVRVLDDDSAALAMVDSNLERREKLLYSEKAWAYRVKLEALNHRGVVSDIPGQLSVETLCEQTGESKSTIFRLIRLTELVPDLLDMVDSNRLAFNPAIELSYLTRLEQANAVKIMAQYEVRPSLSQAQRMKKYSQEGVLTLNKIKSILTEPKKAADKSNLAAVTYRRFFPKGYTPEQMEQIIIKLLSGWHTGQMTV